MSALLAGSLLLVGCESAGSGDRGFVARDSMTRAQTAVKTARDGHRDDAHSAALVNLLDDPDPGVRMYAILSLRRIYGDDLGYRYYAPLPERAAAIARWRSALHEGTLQPRATARVQAGDESSSGSVAGDGTTPTEVRSPK